MIKSICHSHTATSRISSTASPFIWQYEINVGDRHGTRLRAVKTADMNSNFYLSTHVSGCTQLKVLEARETMMPLAHNHAFHPCHNDSYCLSWSTSLLSFLLRCSVSKPLMWLTKIPHFFWCRNSRKKERKGEKKEGGRGRKEKGERRTI